LVARVDVASVAVGTSSRTLYLRYGKSARNVVRHAPDARAIGADETHFDRVTLSSSGRRDRMSLVHETVLVKQLLVFVQACRNLSRNSVTASWIRAADARAAADAENNREHRSRRAFSLCSGVLALAEAITSSRRSAQISIARACEPGKMAAEGWSSAMSTRP